MTNFLFLFFFVIALSLASQILKAEDLTVDSAASEIKFKAIGKPGFLRINGQSKGLTGRLQADLGSVHFELPLETLDTGIDERDRHMKNKYLEVEKFPLAELDASSLKLKVPGDNESDFKAILKLHGLSKEINGQGRLDCKSEKSCTFDGKFSLNLSDFKIDIPSFAGITVAEKVEIEAHIAFVSGK
ncbi:MAG: YceI family protein [Oligoflexales bacterium]|nr:YceI family protein [Oligoflexales bacterium]